MIIVFFLPLILVRHTVKDLIPLVFHSTYIFELHLTVLSLGLIRARAKSSRLLRGPRCLPKYYIPEARHGLHLRGGPRVGQILDNALILVADEEARSRVAIGFVLLLESCDVLLRVPDLFGNIKHPLVFYHLLLVLTWVYQIIIAEIPPFELVSLHLKLSLEAFL